MNDRHSFINPHKGLTGLRRIRAAFFHSLNGLRSALQYESAFRQETALAVILIAAALLLPADRMHKAMLIASVLLVLIVELLNSAVEAVVDRVSFEHHELAKRAKDMGSAAVLISLVNCAAVWLLVLIDAFA